MSGLKKMSWKQKCKKQAMALPIEKRQEVLDYVNSGICLGDIARKAGINMDTVMGIINMNLNKKIIRSLNKKSL
jgi:hypothetical protein